MRLLLLALLMTCSVSVWAADSSLICVGTAEVQPGGQLVPVEKVTLREAQVRDQDLVVDFYSVVTFRIRFEDGVYLVRFSSEDGEDGSREVSFKNFAALNRLKQSYLYNFSDAETGKTFRRVHVTCSVNGVMGS